MNNDSFEYFVGVCLLIAFLIISAAYDYYGCTAKTKDMGISHRWSFLAGCRVEHKPGIWIPLDRYRVIED